MWSPRRQIVPLAQKEFSLADTFPSCVIVRNFVNAPSRGRAKRSFCPVFASKSDQSVFWGTVSTCSYFFFFSFIGDRGKHCMPDVAHWQKPCFRKQQRIIPPYIPESYDRCSAFCDPLWRIAHSYALSEVMSQVSMTSRQCSHGGVYWLVSPNSPSVSSLF